MYSRDIATKVPYYPIGRRRPQMWELRVIIWDCEGIMGIEKGGEEQNIAVNDRSRLNLFFVTEFQDGKRL